MQKGYEHGASKGTKFINVNPTMLRIIADRLDYLAESFPGEEITFDLTAKITLYYDPTVNSKSKTETLPKTEPIYE